MSPKKLGLTESFNWDVMEPIRIIVLSKNWSKIATKKLNYKKFVTRIWSKLWSNRLQNNSKLFWLSKSNKRNNSSSHKWLVLTNQDLFSKSRCKEGTITMLRRLDHQLLMNRLARLSRTLSHQRLSLIKKINNWSPNLKSRFWSHIRLHFWWTESPHLKNRKRRGLHYALEV